MHFNVMAAAPLCVICINMPVWFGICTAWMAGHWNNLFHPAYRYVPPICYLFNEYWYKVMGGCAVGKQIAWPFQSRILDLFSIFRWMGLFSDVIAVGGLMHIILQLAHKMNEKENFLGNKLSADSSHDFLLSIRRTRLNANLYSEIW